MKRPKTLQGYGGKRLDVHPAVWDHILAKTEQRKKWALDHEYADDPEAWPASGMSISMLRERLAKPVQQLAEQSYTYFHHRAHMMSTGYMSTHIDPAAAREWQELTGKPPVIE